MKHLETLLYFACNIILVLLGLILIFTQMEAIGGSLVAGGIAGIVMHWALYIHRRITTEEEILLEKLRDFGIMDIIPRRLTKEEADAIGDKAKKRQDIQGFTCASLYDDMQYGRLQEILKKAKMRILVAHPESPYCKERDSEESLVPGTSKSEIIRVTSFILALKNPNVEIRWYKSIPTTSMLVIDEDDMVIGPYIVGLKHRNTYSIRLKPGKMFGYYRTHFEKVWTDPKLSCEPDLSVYGGENYEKS